jgi:hypothetical protein
LGFVVDALGIENRNQETADALQKRIDYFYSVSTEE